jgi:hypothetical protein
MVKARVKVTLDPPAHGKPGFRLTNGSRSLLFRFKDGQPDELIVGATLEIEQDAEIVPGADYQGVLGIWAEEVATLLQPGEPFIVWYGGDIGHGTVTALDG